MSAATTQSMDIDVAEFLTEFDDIQLSKRR